MATSTCKHQAKIHARRGEAALRRYSAGSPAGQEAELAAAIDDLSMALRHLAPEDPARADVSFLLGAAHLAAHDKQCGEKCPAPEEFAPIVELIALGGARDGAPVGQLSLYAIALDKLYDHTHDRADIDIAIDWLGCAATDRRMTEAERRRMLISAAIQHANRGEALRVSQDRSGPGTESWAAFEAAMKQFGQVLVMIDRRNGRRDATRVTDRLDSWLGQLETYYQRGGGVARDEDLNAMAAVARDLATGMVPGYHIRPYALGRAGVTLIQRLARLSGDPWDLALQAAVSSTRAQAISQAPGFEPDLELAIDALTQAVRLTDPLDRRQLIYTAALCAAHGMRYLASFEDGDLQEVGRLCRGVRGHPQADPSYLRQCGEWLLAVMARRVTGTGTAADAGLNTAWPTLAPSADGDLDTMLGMLARFEGEDGAELAPALAALHTDSVLTRTEGTLTNAELSAEYARAREAAAGLVSGPAAHAVLLLRAAEIGSQLIYRGAAPAGVVDEVAAAFSGARRGLPAGHPLAGKVAARAAAFDSALREPPRVVRSSLAGPECADGMPAHVAAEEFRPPVLDVFSVRALTALGVGIQGWLAGTAGRTAEAATALLSRQPHGTARRAAVLAVLGLAEYETWLRERAGDGLGGSLGHIRAAISELAEGHPLRSRLTLLLVRMLLDRAQTGGDLADADAALTLLDGLRALAGAEPPRGELSELLAQTGPPELGELLAAPPAGQLSPPGAAGYRLDLDAAAGAGHLLRGILAGGAPAPLDTASPAGSGSRRADDDLGTARATLRQVAETLPASDPRRPDVLSDLGLALLTTGPRAADPPSADAQPSGREQDVGQPEAAEVLREASAMVALSPGHPRQVAVALRAAAALAAAEPATAARAATEDDADQRVGSAPRAADEGISLLSQALTAAGLVTAGERSRCLYALGSVLLIRFSRTGRATDINRAIACLEEARAGVGVIPGDPFLAPLLRALAWAYRQDAYLQAREHGQPDVPMLPRHRSRSTGRSLLYAHAQSVLLQSGSRHALAASRVMGQDALRLTEWCITDGRADSGVGALELGRALVLHAATVAADVPALLREAGYPELAAEWAGQASQALGTADGIDAVPGDLRGRVLAALRAGGPDRRLLAAPSVTDIASALRAAGLDALAYLVPASDAVRGRAVIVAADGKAWACPLPGLATGPGTATARFASADHEFRVTRLPGADLADVAAAQRFRRELDSICEWAWTAAIGPLLTQLTAARPARAGGQAPPRVALIPIGILGLIPWHAARRGEPGQARYACEDVIFTTCASARQLIEAVGRPRLDPGAGPAVFVADPSGDLPGSRLEADAIRGALYRGAVHLGRSAHAPVDGVGSPDEILARLPGGGPRAVRPAVLHLGCHAVAGASPEESRLTLAGGDMLPISRILAQAHRRDRDAPGGLVVLASCTSDLALADYDEALTLASAFLAAGATGAIGARWSVHDQFTALLMFMFHRHLVRTPGDGPAAALRAAQMWMLDTAREIPPEMPGELAGFARPSIRHPYAWAAFTYHGQ